jgi:hypothetical protein
MARQLGGTIDYARSNLSFDSNGGQAAFTLGFDYGGSIITLQNGDIIAASGQTTAPQNGGVGFVNVLSPQGVVLGSHQTPGGGIGPTPVPLAPLPDGSFLVDLSELGVTDTPVQIYSPSGTPVAPVGSPTTIGGPASGAAALANGQFVVTWTDFSNTADPIAHASFFNADGSVANANILTASHGTDPSVSQLAGGGFVVTWGDASGALGDPNGGIAAELFNSAGQATTAPFLVATSPNTSNVIGLKNGNYVVTWFDGTGELEAQIFDGSTKVGSAFRVDHPGEGFAEGIGTGTPAIALLGDGDFVIAWNDDASLPGGHFATVAHAQTYHPDGTPFGAEVTVPGDAGVNSMVTGLTAVGTDRFVLNTTTATGASAMIFGASDDASHSELIQNQATGAIDYLSLNGPALTRSSLGTNLAPVVGEGDFNGDGQMDLVTQKNGQIDFVYMNGSQIVGNQLVSGSYWNVVGSADYFQGPLFNRTQGPELITQNAAGQIDLLHFTNGTLDASELLNGNYNHVVGAGDFYGNGNIEIASQDSAGQIDLMTFNGSNLVSSALVPGHYWTVKGVADVNHDGISDFITQNSATGQIDYLMMNGPQVTGSLLENTAYPGWNVVSASQTADQFFHGA